MEPPAGRTKLPSVFQWTRPGRALVFLLSATSIWCLLSEFYGFCSMRTFGIYILLPSTIALGAMAVLNRARGDRLLWRAVLVGALAGFVATCSYDLFRLPWVIGAAGEIGPGWLRLPLFKVFPRFGAMLLGETFTQTQPDAGFTLAAHLLGWIYHFSNGLAFGVMYFALVGSSERRNLCWAMGMAVFLELAMLFTPYTSIFAIRATVLFVTVTLLAHLLFGLSLGLSARRCERNYSACLG